MKQVLRVLALASVVLGAPALAAEDVVIDGESLAALRIAADRIKGKCDGFSTRLTIEADAVKDGKGNAVLLRQLDEQARLCLDMLSYIALIDLLGAVQNP